MVSAGQKSRGSLTGGFLLGVSQEGVGKLWSGLRSSGHLKVSPGLEDMLARWLLMQLLTEGFIPLAFGRNLSSPPPGPLSEGLLKCPHDLAAGFSHSIQERENKATNSSVLSMTKLWRPHSISFALISATHLQNQNLCFFFSLAVPSARYHT